MLFYIYYKNVLICLSKTIILNLAQSIIKIRIKKFTLIIVLYFLVLSPQIQIQSYNK